MEEIAIGTQLYLEPRYDFWNSYIIDGETRQSWLVEGEKIAKSTLQSRGRQFFTAEQREKIEADRDYVARMKPRLKMLVIRATADELREYARLLGVEAMTDGGSAAIRDAS